MNILILHDDVPDDASPDQLDTLVQVNEVRLVLTGLGHRVASLAMVDKLDDTAVQIRLHAPDMVFNLVESVWGKGRWIHLAPSILERLAIPFAGGGSEAIMVTTDKLKAKNRMVEAGLPTPDWITLADIPHSKGNKDRWIIKSVTEHASTGLDEDSVVPGRNKSLVEAEMKRRRESLGGDCFAEQYIAGREFNIAVLAGPYGPEMLPPAEIIFEGYGEDKLHVVGYRAKWQPDSFEYHHTPRSFDFPAQDRRLLRKLERLSLACWDLFDLRGWARVDFRVDQQGRPWILEVNANPCLSSDAGFMAAAQRAGYDPEMVIRRIITDTHGTARDLERQPAGRIASFIVPEQKSPDMQPVRMYER